VLTLLLGLTLGLPSLRVGGVRPIVAAPTAAPVPVVGEIGRVEGGRVARVRVVAKAGEVALDLAREWARAPLVALEEDDFDAARGEERAVPEFD